MVDCTTHRSRSEAIYGSLPGLLTTAPPARTSISCKSEPIGATSLQPVDALLTVSSPEEVLPIPSGLPLVQFPALKTPSTYLLVFLPETSEPVLPVSESSIPDWCTSYDVSCRRRTAKPLSSPQLVPRRMLSKIRSCGRLRKRNAGVTRPRAPCHLNVAVGSGCA